MKRVVAIFVLAVIATHLIGFYAYFVVRMNQIHVESRAQLALLPDDQLTALRIPVSEVQSGWFDEMEFEWQGKMYDVARYVKEAEQITFFVMHDDAEDGLLSFLDTIMKRSLNDEQTVPGSFFQFQTLIFLPNAALALITPSPENSFSAFYCNNYEALNFSVLLPPPRS